MRSGKPNPKAVKKKSSPIRVVVRCAWSGARLAVPTTTPDGNEPLPPIRGSSTLLDLVLRLESALPPSLLRNDDATLVCLRKLVPQFQWESTTLKQMLDGDDGGAGVVLTLDLGRGNGNGSGADGTGGAPQKSDPMKNAMSSAASSLNIKPVVASPEGTTNPSATMASLPEPMDVSTDGTIAATPPADTINTMLPDQAWSKVLQSNFDATTRDCLNTLVKIIDNLLSKPNEPKVRSMRCANPAFEKKVGRCKGAYDFLYSIGFTPKCPGILGGTQSGTPEFLELTPKNESRETLIWGRNVLAQSAARDLGMEEKDFPAAPKLPVALPASTLAALPPSAAAAAASSSRGPDSGFNVYRTHSHNVQSAALGAPDPYAESSVSTTERRLQQLQSKKDKMERDMQSQTEADRGLVAYLAGSGPVVTEAATVATGGGGKTDSSLVAARMRRMEEERKKREEGGFTTKAMRDLERMKKAKVYSHAQIRVNFPEGTHLHAKFLPREKVSSIRTIIQSAFQPSLAQTLRFDLYVAPPRRLLKDGNTLEEEGLVPAAKIHVSWKAGASPVGGAMGYYLRDELFAGGKNAASVFPDAKPIVKEKRALAKSNGTGNSSNNDSGGAPSKEDLLMQRMLGKKPGLLGRKSSSGGASQDEAKKKGGKPNWFKN
mmetsp:Transcript_28327/g.59996  ORF Transcript_28327/g.59996 Transcript_28327/m.59996 type:complete len:659 (+) Transcript_28327:119-2095(+)